MTPQEMANTWLGVWLEGAGIHGLHPAPDEPLLRWLLVLHERAVDEEQRAREALSEHQLAVLDQLQWEALAAQKDTLPPEAQAAVRSGDIYAVRAAETAALVWTLAGLDAYTSPNETLEDWRLHLSSAARVACGLSSKEISTAEHPVGL